MTVSARAQSPVDRAARMCVSHHAVARLGGSDSPETGGPAAGRGPSSHAATGPQYAPTAPCGLPPATHTYVIG